MPEFKPAPHLDCEYKEVTEEIASLALSIHLDCYIFELLLEAVVKLNCHLYITVGLYVFAFLLHLIPKAMKISVKVSLFPFVCLGHQKVRMKFDCYSL